MKLKLEGIWTPIPTPLTKRGRVDTDATRRLVDFLIEAGIDGLLPLGTSGEFALLQREERKTLVDVVVDQADSRVPVVAGVSDPSIENVVQLSSDAKEAGADAVIATPPYYFTATDEGHYHHFKAISEAIDLPLLIYNIPEWTHSFLTPETVQRLADEKLVVGMKYTENNFLNLVRFLKTSGSKIAIFAGSDAMAYSNLEFGGSGAIIGSANVAPKVASKIFDDYKEGDLKGAREAQERLLPIVMALSVGKYPAALKEAMSLIGVSVGPLKEPLQALSIAEKRIVAGLLRSGGFLS
ncbi:4-hydroxy-tetrahydrodipicolinate synthase [archaeon 13_1_20CM_2_51_12]|nr:MAG: 4-hydroxy-tetrahydrodipicolinate synthase [Crenarchaeota archaeon 13_1_40CM_3_52_17]OLE70827.1 MAG: 4-hydroxy-tetrahydrodipicolinate synthase [archaeon 13_1_20CM_2_51_12]